MRLFLIIILFLVAGSAAGWFLRDMSEKRIHAVRPFTLIDKLSEKTPSLFAEGTWRGGGFSNTPNTARIFCDPAAKTCETIQADVVRSIDRSTIDLNTATFSITRIDQRSLIAERMPSSDCARATMLVDRVAKRVSIVETKISQDVRCAAVQDAPVTLFLGDPTKS